MKEWEWRLMIELKEHQEFNDSDILKRCISCCLWTVKEKIYLLKTIFYAG